MSSWNQVPEPERTRILPPTPAPESVPMGTLPPPHLAPPNPSTRSDAYPIARWLHGGLAAIAWLLLVGQALLLLTEPGTTRQLINNSVIFVGGLVFLTAFLIAISETLLAANPIRYSGALQVVRLSTIVMSVACIGIFIGLGSVALRATNQSLQEPLAIGLYVVLPLLLLLSYGFLGPRPRLAFRHVTPAVVIPILWMVYASIYGAITKTYVYDFLNVSNGGWVGVFANVLFLGTVLVAMAVGLVFLDRALPYAPRR